MVLIGALIFIQSQFMAPDSGGEPIDDGHGHAEGQTGATPTVDDLKREMQGNSVNRGMTAQPPPNSQGGVPLLSPNGSNSKGPKAVLEVQ